MTTRACSCTSLSTVATRSAYTSPGTLTCHTSLNSTQRMSAKLTGRSMPHEWLVNMLPATLPVPPACPPYPTCQPGEYTHTAQATPHTYDGVPQPQHLVEHVAGGTHASIHMQRTHARHSPAVRVGPVVAQQLYAVDGTPLPIVEQHGRRLIHEGVRSKP